jgi:hypothetical protein
MSKASVSEKPVEDNPRSYPWGDNTGTYKLWIVLFTINVLFLSVVFLINVEIPLIADLLNPEAIKGSSGSLATGNTTTGTASTSPGFESPIAGGVVNPVVDWISNYGIWVIAANIVLVWVTKTLGKWVTSLEKWCKNLCKCKWYKPWCCLGRLFCWFVTITKWVLYVVSVLSAVITSVLVWVTANSGSVQG